MYKKAGIDNIRSFYKDKFAFNRDFDFTRDPLNFYDAYYFKFVWVYSQIEAGSKVLDFGCGSGSLASLKRKDCEITGIDLSEKALRFAQEVNGYDRVYSGDLEQFELQGYFDYVVSIDVFGHIPFEEKDAVIKRLKTFLKPGGVMLHGIECGEIDYDSMSAKALNEFIKVEGHVGIENKPANLDRFRKFFKYVDGEVRYVDLNNVEDWLIQIERYGAKIEPNLAGYLSCMGSAERKAFDVATGLGLINMEKQRTPSMEHDGGFLLLRASDVDLKEIVIQGPGQSMASYESGLLENNAVCRHGWHPVETNQSGVFRWSESRATICLPATKHRQLHLKIYSHYPLIHEKHADVFFVSMSSGNVLKQVRLTSHEPLDVCFDVNPEDRKIEMIVDVTWVPCLFRESNDSRELGVGVSRLEMS